MKEKIKDENKKDTKQKKPRKKASWLANTTLTLLLIIIIIAVVVAINIIVEKQDIADIDLTGNKLYSLSQESIDKISSVKAETKITLYQMSNYPEAINYAKLYCQKNSNITYEELTDASQRPDLQEKYSLGTSITSAVVIVEANNRDKIVSANDFYAYDNTTYQQYDVTEQKMTNAILDVNLETNPKIYFSTTHAQDSNYYQVARELLKNEANDVEDLDLLVNAKVPDDCNVLVITSLKEDFTEFEKDLILEYINNGGNLMILEDPNKDNKDLTNFQAILDVYGASISNGTMFEQNTSKIVGYTNLVLPTVSSASKITKDIASSGNVAILGGGIINFKDSEELENLGVTVENLVTASSTAFLRTDSSITSSSVTQNDQLLSGGEPIASAITKKINDEKTSKLILVANSMFASDWYVTLNSSSGNSSQVVAINFYNNRDLEHEGKNPIAPSDVPPLLIAFLERNRKRWVANGDAFARDVFIDSADQATMNELIKYNNEVGSIYDFYSAWKKLTIIDRIAMQQGWMKDDDYLIVDECVENIHELNTYSWKEDKAEPEDANDHTINADQYSWIPYKHLIGGMDKGD
mgnify:CR=1 FL=1